MQYSRYGYTADNGKTYPFRDKFIGMMPTLDEVLQAFPDRKLLIDQKDQFMETVELLVDSFKKCPLPQRQNIFFFSGEEQYERLKQAVTEVQKIFPTRQGAKDCIPEYLALPFSGCVSPGCGKYAFGIPARYLHYVPGWSSHLFLVKARAVGSKLYVIDVDTPEALQQIKYLPLDGIITNRIEIIGSLLCQK